MIFELKHLLDRLKINLKNDYKNHTAVTNLNQLIDSCAMVFGISWHYLKDVDNRINFQASYITFLIDNLVEWFFEKYTRGIFYTVFG